MKWMMVMVIGVYATLMGGEIPKEEGLEVCNLKNGVQVWMKPFSHPPERISCRIVAKQAQEALPRIFVAEGQLETFEDELVCLIEEFKASGLKEEECQMGVVIVGDFDTKEMQPFISSIFEDVRPKSLLMVRQPVTIHSSDQGGYFTLSYAHPLKELKTDQDLKKLWVTSLLQAMTQEKFRKVMNHEGVQLLTSIENRHLLPASDYSIKCKLLPTHDLGSLLTKCLKLMQQIKRSGFTELELSDAKAPVQKKFPLVYCSQPDSVLLADYCTAHFAIGAGCPDYTMFMQMSDKTIRDIRLDDIHTALQENFKDKERNLEVAASKGMEVSEGSLLNILHAFTADEVVFVPGSQQTSDTLTEAQAAFAQLPLKPDEVKRIKELVEHLIYKHEITLGLHRKEILKLGESIQHVHPLKFLEVVVTNPELKKGLREKVYGRPFKWGGFLNGDSGQRGFAQKMDHESNHGNLEPYRLGFSHVAQVHPDTIRRFFEKREWEKLVLFLIEN